MPVKHKVIRYGCSYGCQRRYLADKKAMENHEKTCWCNPANRTCKTCNHYHRWRDDMGYDDRWNYTIEGEDCAIGADNREYISGVGMPEFVVMQGCDEWQPRGEDWKLWD